MDKDENSTEKKRYELKSVPYKKQISVEQKWSKYWLRKQEMLNDQNGK